MGEKLKRIRIQPHGVFSAVEAERQDKQWRSKNLWDSGVKDHLTSEDVRDIGNEGQPRDTKFIRDVHAWMLDEHAKPVLILSGTVGRGKTYAAAWALAHRTGAYVPANEFVRVFSARFGDDREKQERLLHQPLLVIDDVGREGRANHEQMLASLVEVVDARRSINRRTIIVTNEDRRHFADRYGDERLISRLAQSGLFRSDSGEDYRRDGKMPGPLPLDSYDDCDWVIEPATPEEVAEIARKFQRNLARIGGAS